MSSKWNVLKTRNGIIVKGDDLTILVDPQGVPKEVLDVDFVVLTSRENYDERAVEDVLSESGAVLVTPFGVRRRIAKKYYVDVVDSFKGLVDDVWVYAKDNELALFLYQDEGPIVVTHSLTQEEIDELSNEVYGIRSSKVIRGKYR